MAEQNAMSALLTQFFYENNRLPIPEFGSFELEDPIPEEMAEMLHEPGTAHRKKIRFIRNPQEAIDAALVDFIVAHSLKMKSIAVADLESLSSEAKELLNLGQPYSFPGIGTLQKNPQGDYKFTAVTLLPDNGSEHPTDAHQQHHNHRQQEEHKHFSGRPPLSKSPWLFVMGGLVIAALLIYFLFFHRNKPISASSSTTKTAVPHTDTSSMLSVATDDSEIQYEVVFDQAGKADALKRYRQLTSWGHRVSLRTLDSTVFTLAIPFVTAPEDTSVMKDSIRLLYGHPVYIRYTQP